MPVGSTARFSKALWGRRGCTGENLSRRHRQAIDSRIASAWAEPNVESPVLEGAFELQE